VISMSEVALARVTSPEGREPIEAARHSAGILLGLLNNILDVTRAEAGAIELHTGSFSIHNALAQLLLGPAAEARAKGLSFDASADADLVEVRVGDEARFAQIAMNLVSNALKFTTTGGVTVRLMNAPEDPDRIRLVVTDTGRGIPSDKLDRIFEPFEQADPSDAQRLGGAGLGLSIVKELARLMSGSVSVQSTERGSTFSVELPLPRASAAGASGPSDLLHASPLEAETPRPPGQARRVLVCDDDPVGRRALCALLRLRGHAVVSTSHAAQALAELASADFDLLITDIEMPGMDGVELTRQIRDQERRGKPRLLIIAATAYASEDDARRLLAAGIDAHLAKPFTPQQLDRLMELTRARGA
jgi:two-component system, sensor histidine kinase